MKNEQSALMAKHVERGVHDSGAGPNNVQRVLIQKKIRRRAKRDGEKQKKVSFN